jgi:competence protein ComEC
VDGLRIAIISAIFFGLFRAVGVPRAFCGVLLAPLLLFYAAMTGWPASAIRAIVMILVVFGGWALKRPSDLINSLFAAAIIILLWEPRQLFQAGFQLSFFVVLCIVLILPFFKNIGERLLRPDPLLPESLRPRWQKILRPPVVWLADLFLTSTAAWLGSIPLVAYYFHLFTPLSGPANVLAVPLCGLVLICNLASLLVAAWLPFAAELFNNAGWFFMEAIRTTSHWSANWLGAWFYLPMPGLFTIAVYYFVLLALLTGWLFQGRLRRWKIGGCAVLLAVWCGLWLWQLPATQITVLPLNGGHAVFVHSPGPRNDWLIDCGTKSSADSVVKPFLRARGVNRLPHFVLTHGEIGFSGGAQYLWELFRPREVFLNPLHFRSPDYRAFAEFLRHDAALQKPLVPGDQLGPMRVLYPAPDFHFSKGNDNALVLRLETNGVRVLFLSDLGHAGQNALLAQDTNELRADIVVAGVPADSEPLSDTLLDAIQPRVIIMADSDYPAPRKSGAKLVERLGRRNIPVLYTHDTRAVTVTIRADGWKLRAMDGTALSASDPSLAAEPEQSPR